MSPYAEAALEALVKFRTGQIDWNTCLSAIDAYVRTQTVGPTAPERLQALEEKKT